LLAPAQFGGLETVVRELSTAQRAAGVDAHCALLFPDHLHCEFEYELVAHGIPVHRIPMRRRAYLDERAAVRSALRQLRPTVLHAHGYRPTVLHGDIARELGIAMTATVHGFTGGSMKDRLFDWLVVRSAARAGAAVAVSRPIAERLAAGGVSAERLHLIPNALRATPVLGRAEARLRLGVPADSHVIGWIGRLSHEKAPDVLLEALPLIPASRVVFIGDGPLREGLERRSRELGLSHRVSFLGPIPRAATLLSGIDLLALSSRTEGTPMVLLEAMHARVPIVATRVGGVPDLLDDSMARLVAPSDPAALAAALRASIADDAERAARAVRAEARAEEFSPEQWVARYRLAYDGALTR
jgi:glycosyltransferase involved in cell wall biosynthesis